MKFIVISHASKQIKTKSFIPYAVFKSIVWCPWIHIVTTWKLFDISESLKLWCINNFHTQWPDLDGAMYRVIDYLLEVPYQASKVGGHVYVC
jgi:hypothetical protein